MSDAPEKIWAKPRHDSWNSYGDWHAGQKGGGTEYTRTDTIPSAAYVAGLRDALEDAQSALNYISEYYGRLHGVGWDRCAEKTAAALASRPASPDVRGEEE